MKEHKKEELSCQNYDIFLRKKVGYWHIQKTNIFHKVASEPEYTIESRMTMTSAAKHHTQLLLEDREL